MSENGEIYTAGKNFTLPLTLTAWTNSTSAWILKLVFCINVMIKRPCLKFPKSHYKFLDWKWPPPPLALFQKFIWFGSQTLPKQFKKSKAESSVWCVKVWKQFMWRGYLHLWWCFMTNIKPSLPGMHINDIESRLRDSYMIRCTGNWPAGKLTATLVVALLMFNGCGMYRVFPFPLGCGKLFAFVNV